MKYKIIEFFKKKHDSTNFMIIFLSFSSIVSTILTLISGLFVAKWILPSELGEFNSFTIFSSYIILAQVGIPIALGRELPLYLGRGEKEKAESYASVSHYYALFLGIIILIITSLLALYFLLYGNYKYAAGSFVVGILSFEGFYVTQYLKVLYKGNRDFNKLSVIGFVVSFVSFLSIIFVYYFKFYGLCIRTVLSFTTVLLLTFLWRPNKIKPVFTKNEFLHLLKLGFPMYLVTNVYSLWPLLQKTLILSLGGKTYLGLYALATMVQGAFRAVIGSISTVVYATMAKEWGKGSTLLQLFNVALKPVYLAAILFVFALPIGYFLLPIFVEKFIPNYIEGVVAAQWMMVTSFIALFNVWTNIYNVVNHQRQKLSAFLFGVVGWIVTLFILYYNVGISLEIFPQSMAVGFFMILIYNLRYIKKNKTLTF